MRVIPKVKSIKIRETGIIKRADIEFKGGLNIVFGKGATGKTTVIKALEEALESSPENIELLSGNKIEGMSQGERAMLTIEGIGHNNMCFLMDGELDRINKENLLKALQLLSEGGNQVITTLRSHINLPQIKANVIDTARFELED